MKSSTGRSQGKSSKRKLNQGYLRFVLAGACIFAFLLILSILFAKSDINDSIIFLYSENCAECGNIEPEIKETAIEAGIKFYKIRYDDLDFAPGIAFIHNNTMLITGYKDRESLKKQVCGFMKSRKACRMAGEVWE